MLAVVVAPLVTVGLGAGSPVGAVDPIPVCQHGSYSGTLRYGEEGPRQDFIVPSGATLHAEGTFEWKSGGPVRLNMMPFGLSLSAADSSSPQGWDVDEGWTNSTTSDQLVAVYHYYDWPGDRSGVFEVQLDMWVEGEGCLEGEGEGGRESDGYDSDPVATSSGNMFHPATDVVVPGGLGAFVRSLNTRDTWSGFTVSRNLSPDPEGKAGIFGAGWASWADVRAWRQNRPGADSVLLMRMPDGSRYTATDGTFVGSELSWTPPPGLLMESVMRDEDSSGGGSLAYEWTFANGAVWELDADGRLVAVTDPYGPEIDIARGTDGVPDRITWSQAGLDGWAVELTDTGGDGLIDQVAGPFPGADSGPSSATPRRDYDYDGAGRLTFASAPYVGTPTTLGQHYTIGSNGRVAAIIDDVSPTEQRTRVSNTYDAALRVDVQTHATGEVSDFDYARTTSGAPVTTVEHADGPVTETVVYHHDEIGRLIGIDDPYAESTAREWDRNRLASHTSRRGGETTMDWDAEGRLATAALAHPDTAGAQSGSVSVTYCGPGDTRPVDTTDAAGIVTRTWWTTGSDPYVCDAGRQVPVKVTQAHGTALAADTTFTSADGLVTSMTDADGVRTDMTWDPDLRVLLSSTDFPTGPANPGRTTYYGFDAAGRPLVVRDPGGIETWTIRDAFGRVVTQVGPVAVTRTCGSTSCTFGTTPPAGPTRSSTYDLVGELTSSTDEAGKVTTRSVTYPSGGGRVETVTAPPHGDDASDPLSTVATVTTSTYDRFDRLATVTVGDPSTPSTLATTTHTYDPLGRLRQTSQDLGGSATDLVTSYAYDADGNQTRVVHGTDPNDTDAAVAVRRYDLRGRLVEEWGPTGDTSAPSSVSGSSAAAVRRHTQWTYDTADRLLATIVGDGAEQQTTFHRYDAAGRLRYVIVDRDGDQVMSTGSTGNPTDATDGVTEYTYTPAGRTLQHIASQVNAVTFDWINGNQANKSPTAYDYDDAGQLVSTTNPNGKVTTRTWTVRGQLEKVTQPGGYWVSYGYDAAGRRTRITNPSPTGTGTVDALTGYDARGLVTSQTDAHTSGSSSPPTQTFTYHDDGSLATATNALGGPTGTVSYVYDARGNRTGRTSMTQDSSLTSAYAVTDAWAYDLADRVTGEQLAGAPGPTTTDYDATTGRPTTVTQPSGRVTTTAYWNSGAVRSLTTTKPADGFGPADSTRTCSWYDTVGQRRHTLADDLVGAACTGGDVTVETWTAAGTRAAVTAPDTSQTPGSVDETLSYTWDLQGNLRTVTDPQGVQLRWSYGRSGQLTRVDRPATSTDVAVYTYDSHGRLSRETTGDGSLHRTYTLHANGSPLPRRMVEQGTGESIRTTDHTYRPDGRLGSSVTGSRTVAWSYDAAGQVTGRTDTAGPDHGYTYGPRGLRLSETVDAVTTTSTYDAGARLVDATDPGGTTTYGYDADGRRTSVTGPGGPTLATTYDSRGLPVEIDLGATDVQQRTYDADRRLVEIAETGAPTLAQVWNPAAPTWQPHIVRDASGWQRIEHGLDGVVSVQDDSGTVVPFRQDRDGSTTTSVPVPTAPTVYEPFGDGGDPDLLAGYRGERELAGLIHLRHRDLDPATGSFTTRDPLEGIVATPTETNPYHYADNDPANRRDPLGLSPEDDDVDCDTANANDPAYQMVYGSHPGVSCDDMWREVTKDAIGCFGDALTFGIVSEVVGDDFRKDNMFCAAGSFEGFGAGLGLGGAGAADDVGRWADDAGNVGDDAGRYYDDAVNASDDVADDILGGADDAVGGGCRSSRCTPGSGGGGGSGAGGGGAGAGGGSSSLVDELINAGVKVSPEEIVHIGRNQSGKIVWLERGNPRSGLQHILQEHGDDFVNNGIARQDIADYVFHAATRGRIVGYQGADEGRAIFEVAWNGQTRRVAITVGDNGYIVGANPRSFP